MAMLDRTPVNSAIVAFHEREMEWLRLMVQGGSAVAVAAALNYCEEHKWSAPDWLISASKDLLCNLLKAERPARRGRAATHVARHRQDTIDFTRWSTVHWQRESQKKLLHEVEIIKEERRNLPRDRCEDRENLQKWLGTTLNRAFECSAMILEGTEAYGSPETIKRSYLKVERAMSNSAEAIRYHQLDPQFLMKLGIKWEPFVRPGRKLVPLYKIQTYPYLIRRKLENCGHYLT